MMDVIKGTMTEIYNDLSKSTTGNTIAEVCVSLVIPAVAFLEFSHLVFFYIYADSEVED